MPYSSRLPLFLFFEPITVFMYLQNPECFVHDSSSHISGPISRSIFKPSHFLFMSLWQTPFFFPRDIYFCQVHLHSLESNAAECFPSFPLALSLHVSSKNDAFYHSQSIFNYSAWFWRNWLKRLRAGEKCVDWILTGCNSKIKKHTSPGAESFT